MKDPNIVVRGDWRSGSIRPLRRRWHSLIDKVYQRKNLEIAWGRIKANRGSGGVDGQTLADF